jgi:hypothetical protein
MVPAAITVITVQIIIVSNNTTTSAVGLFLRSSIKITHASSAAGQD